MEMMLGEDRVLFCCTRSAGFPCGMRQATPPGVDGRRAVGRVAADR